MSYFQLRGYIRMVRLRVCVLGLVLAVLSIFLNGEIDQVRSVHVSLGLVVVPLVIGFAFVINDYVDAELDKIAKADRPIPSGRVTRRQALGFALILVGLALAFGWSLGVAVGIFTSFNLLLSAAYSYFLKETLFMGNVAVSILNGSVVLYGSVLVKVITVPAALIMVLIVLYSFAYEVLYAVEDHEGDVQGGVHTTASRIGKTRSLLLVRFLNLISIPGVIIPWAAQLASLTYLFFAAVLYIVPTLWVVWRLTGRSDLASVKAARSMMTLVYYTSLIPILVLYFNI